MTRCDECADTIDHPGQECPAAEFTGLLRRLRGESDRSVPSAALEAEIEEVAGRIPVGLLAELAIWEEP